MDETMPRAGRVAWAVLVALTCLVIVPSRPLVGLYPTLGAALAVLVVAVALSLVPAARGASTRRAAVPPSLVALLVLMAASTLWSSVPMRTAYDTLTCLALAGAAWIVARHGGARAAVDGILAFGAVVLVASAANWLVDPASATFEESSDLQGIYGNRNALGLALTLVIPALLATRPTRRALQVLHLLGGLAIVAAIVLSGSRTSMLVGAAVMLAWGLLALARHRPRWAVAAGVAVAVGLIAFVLNPGAVLHALGRSATLTGRTRIWEATAGLAAESPLWGHGFFISWPVDSAQNRAVADPGGPVSHAHNELLGWAAALGLFGVVLVVLTYVLVVVSSFGRWRGDRSPTALWMLLTVVALIVRGIAEQAETNPQAWFIFVIVCACALAPVRWHPRHARSIVPGRDGPTRLDEERTLPRS